MNKYGKIVLICAAVIFGLADRAVARVMAELKSDVYIEVGVASAATELPTKFGFASFRADKNILVGNSSPNKISDVLIECSLNVRDINANSDRRSRPVWADISWLRRPGVATFKIEPGGDVAYERLPYSIHADIQRGGISPIFPKQGEIEGFVLARCWVSLDSNTEIFWVQPRAFFPLKVADLSGVDFSLFVRSLEHPLLDYVLFSHNPKLQNQSNQGEGTQYNRGNRKSSIPSPFLILFVGLFLLLCGLFVCSLGWQHFYDDRRFIGAAYIGFGFLLASSGPLLLFLSVL